MLYGLQVFYGAPPNFKKNLMLSILKFQFPNTQPDNFQLDMLWFDLNKMLLITIHLKSSDKVIITDELVKENG